MKKILKIEKHIDFNNIIQNLKPVEGKIPKRLGRPPKK